MTEDNAPLQFPIDPKTVLFVIHDAVEGGSAAVGLGWCQLESYKWSHWYKDGPDELPLSNDPNVTPDQVLLRIREVDDDWDEEDEASDEGWVDLTFAKMEAAIQWTLTNYPHLGGFEVHKNVVTDWDYDAIGADVALQKAVLGEVIYG